METFRAFDADGSGTIDSTEMAVLMADLGEPVTADRAAEVLDEIDKDKSGEVALEEFAMWWLAAEHPTVEQQAALVRFAPKSPGLMLCDIAAPNPHTHPLLKPRSQLVARRQLVGCCGVISKRKPQRRRTLAYSAAPASALGALVGLKSRRFWDSSQKAPHWG